MAWADGVLEPAEVDMMSTQLSQHFAADPGQQAALAQELKDYFSQNVPIDEVLPQITGEADRRLILKLGYLVVAASARQPGEPMVNMDEVEAFQHLVEIMNLSPKVVHEVSEEARLQLSTSDVEPMEALIQGFTEHYS